MYFPEAGLPPPGSHNFLCLQVWLFLDEVSLFMGG